VARTLFPVPVFVTLTTFFEASSARAVEAVRLLSVVVPDALRVVNAPVLAVEPPMGVLLMLPPVMLTFDGSVNAGFGAALSMG
jgi:hypothetical protein